ncbi:MAG: putative transporter, partial [Geminicoccaceae bacterium]|nr:putative transporter [Geminicoccaceae bacterium]
MRALENSGYFRIVRQAASEAETDWLLASGEVQFVLHIPTDFGRDLMRRERPSVLLEVDATDPVATGSALAAISAINRRALDHDLTGALADLGAAPPPFELLVQRRYNPEGITRYNIVPGLLGVVL